MLDFEAKVGRLRRQGIPTISSADITIYKLVTVQEFWKNSYDFQWPSSAHFQQSTGPTH